MATSPQDSRGPLAHENTALITKPHHNLESVTPPSTSNPAKPYKRILFILCLILVLLQCGDELSASPNTRIAEAIICYRHYESADPTRLLADRATVGPGAIGGVAEITCKVEAVQSQLSSLRGYQGFLNGLPSLLLALPFGWAADKYGRKPFMFLGTLSFVFKATWIQTVCWFWQSFDIRWTWASALHGLMAGSSPVISALFFVIVSDIVPASERSKVFLRLGGVNLISAVCMPLLSAWLMEITPWVPAIAGTLLQISAVIGTLFLPESLDYNQTPKELLATSQAETNDPSSSPKSHLARLRDETAFLTTTWRIPFLIASFLIHLTIIDSPPLQLQYLSTRYTLTFARATTLLTLRSTFNITLFFVLLPLIANHLTKALHLSTQRSDLLMSRFSLLAWTLGWIAFGLAPTLLSATIGMGITALGSGSFFLIRSILTPLVPGRQVARLYSLISVVDTLGAMLGAPLLAGLFNRGLRLGGYGVGLPWYFLGGICAVFGVVLCVVGSEKGEDGREMVDGEE
jgi:MFS family permease